MLRKLAYKLRDPRRPRPIKNPEQVAEKIRESSIFEGIPDDSIAKMVECMDTVKRLAGDVIVKEGGEGDYYYLLLEGQAVVERTGSNGKPQVVAELSDGGVFGEEALISYARRNATVRMATDGILRRLPRDAFVKFVQDPLVQWVTPREAQQMINEGAQWVDVREGAEKRRNHLRGAVTLPLEQLRDRLNELSMDETYICYCENGRLSATAAFLMRQRGYNVRALRGGLRRFRI
jgi:CRP-like cAMP-binding protein